MNETIKTILERRSRRAFAPKQITSEERDLILKCGAYAPSAKNQQPWHFTVLQNPTAVNQLVSLCKEHMQTENNPFYDAPTIIVVSAKADGICPAKDGSLALQNMMLAVHAIGLGSCWINCVNGVFQKPNGKEFFKSVGVPDGYEMVGSLAVGYPVDNMPTLKPREVGTINIVE